MEHERGYTQIRKKKATKALPILRRLVQSRVEQWELERRLERLFDCQITDLGDYVAALAVAVNPESSNLQAVVGMDDAQQLAVEVLEGLR